MGKEKKLKIVAEKLLKLKLFDIEKTNKKPLEKSKLSLKEYKNLVNKK